MSSSRAAVAAAFVTVVAVVAVVVALTVNRSTVLADLSPGVVPPSQGVAAPELVGISHFDNTEPLTLDSLKGRVVLVDFWTYTCINCRRTFPFLRELQKTYKDLTIVGVHSPEFGFEKVHDNVARAVRDLDVTWPVAEDPQMATWQAFGNQYWPAKYLIDREGRVRYTHFGEGDEKATEDAVRSLLREGGGVAPTQRIGELGADQPRADLTPETYFGARASNPVRPGTTVTRHDKVGARDEIALDGRVTGLPEAVELLAGASISQKFSARDVYATTAPASGSVVLDVTLDGRPVPLERRGTSLIERNGRTVAVLSSDDLLHLLTGTALEPGLLTITAQSDGARFFTFTYGA